MTSGTLTTNNNLTFRSTADYTGQFAAFPSSGTSISGNVTVEKYVKARRAFRLLSPTVTSSSSIKENWQENGATYQSNPNPGFGTHITGDENGSNGFDATITGNPSLFTFNNSTQSWVNIANTNSLTLDAGTPYRLMIRGDRSVNIYQSDNNPTPTNTIIRSTGTLSTGDFTYSSLSSTADADNFVGNPYQCAVDLSSVITSSNSNLDYTKVFMWDPFLNIRGGWATVTLANNTVSPTSSSATKYLQPGQSFFVSTAASPSSAPSITFSETDKYTGGTFETVNLLQFESSRNPYINLVLINQDMDCR
jgi:hypothetical protein